MLSVVQIVVYGYVYRSMQYDLWQLSLSNRACTAIPPVRSMIFRPLCYNACDIMLVDVFKFNTQYNKLSGFMKFT